MDPAMHGESGEGVAEAAGVVRAGVGGTQATAELTRLLGVQARLGDARGGVVLRVAGEGRVDVLAAWPEGLLAGGTPTWVQRAGEGAPRVVGSGRTAILEEGAGSGQEEGAGGALVVVSLGSVGEARGVAAFWVEHDAADVGRAAARLELGAAVIGLHSLRMELGRMERRSGLLASAVEIGAEIGAERRFVAAAMGLANAVVARFDADRVSVGMIGASRDDFVRVRAMSHTERVHRKMELVRAIEGAMQECADQDEEVLWMPEGAGGVEAAGAAEWFSKGVVDRAARELGQREGGVSVLSLPLRDGEGVVGVLTVERGGGHGIAGEEAEALRLVGNVVGSRLAELEERDRWIGARAALWARRGLGRLVGPEHTWAKAAAVVAAALVAFAIFGRGMETAQGTFSIEAVGERVVAAPFDGFVENVSVEVGDKVVGGKTVLGRLDDSSLRLELAEARAKERALEQSAAAARGRGQIADAQIAEAQVDEAKARIGLLEHRIARATLIAPEGGVVIAGMEKRAVGGPVELGAVMFEIAPAGSLRVVVAAPEDRVGDLAVGQKGWIAPAAYPGRRIGFTVTRIEPVARAVEGANIFRVYADLADRPEWLRAGMEGVARIDIGRASYAWIWGRDLVAWVRMRVWW